MLMDKTSTKWLALLSAMVVCAGCTVSDTEIPQLTGPSELALSVSIVASPDTIRYDGADWSTVIVRARDINGAPVTGVQIRLDIQTAAGGPADFGTLSNRLIVTGADGTATATYTAPTTPPALAPVEVCPANSFNVVLAGPCVGISATPVGNSFFTFPAQIVYIHLVPPSVITPRPGTGVPTASFEFSPSAPVRGQVVIFDASASQASAGNSIVEYKWNWGDGEIEKATTSDEEHDYQTAGVFSVQLTITDSAGLTASISKTLTVSP